jgi:tetratricopeptide (TPR) repeat protein
MCDYTGAVGIALADIRWSQVQTGRHSQAWLDAASTRAVSLFDRGAYAESEALFREMVDVQRIALGDEHPHTLDSMAALGKMLTVQDKHADAERIQRELLRAHTGALGPDHPTTRKAACRLKKCICRAVAVKAKAEPDAAKQAALRAECVLLASEVLAETTRVYGEGHMATLIAEGDVASTMKSCGSAAQAVPIFRRVLAAEIRARGEGHRDTFGTAANLAAALAELGQFDEAESILIRTTDVSTRVLGPGHPDTVLYKQWLVNVRLDTLTAAHNAAVGMRGSGNAAQAVPILRHVLASKTRMLGAAHPTMFATSAHLAVALSDLGHFDEAKRILARALKDSIRVLGSDDPGTIMCAQHLLDVCAAAQPRAARAAAAARARDPAANAAAEAAEAELMAMLEEDRKPARRKKGPRK